VNLKLDKIDRKILDILQSNAKITNAQLSKEIGLSPAPTLERVKKLENSGIIKSYHAKLDTDKIGMGVSTFVYATLKGHNIG
jgi:DNA-binding Lrp family transcriptional regulator